MGSRGRGEFADGTPDLPQRTPVKELLMPTDGPAIEQDDARFLKSFEEPLAGQQGEVDELEEPQPDEEIERVMADNAAATASASRRALDQAVANLNTFADNVVDGMDTYFNQLFPGPSLDWAAFRLRIIEFVTSQMSQRD